MIGKELKKLSRRELVDIIYQMKKIEEEKQEQITALEESLQEKRIRVSVAGSIAEAAVDITQIFSVAQSTADLYLHEISALKEETERECAQKVTEAKEKAEAILAEARQQIDQLEASYNAEYAKYEQLKAQVLELEERKARG